MSDRTTEKNDFIWGVATSSYQIEGAHNIDGRGPSVWDVFSHTEGKVNNNDNGDIACDHYHLWEQDIELMKDLGVNSYRFSIAWPRIFPKGTENIVNQKGLDFYDRLVDLLLENNIRPFVTLNHWDMPQGLEDIGGWTNRNVVEEFVKYGYHVSNQLGDRVADWITHNEPWCISYLGYIEGRKPPGLKNKWAKSLTVAHHLLVSHGSVIPEIRKNVENAKVGITLNLNTAIPASDSIHDREACDFYDAQFNRLFLDPLYNEAYPEILFDELQRKKLISADDLSFIKDGDLKTISTSTDFLGVNYYSRAVVRNEEIEEKQNSPTNVEMGPKTDFGWEIHSPGIYDLLMRLHNDYRVNEMLITENGCSYGDSPDEDKRIRDTRRIEYHRSHIDQVLNAIDSGAPCTGYFAWSLMDNFEWAEGYNQRFGLIWVDFETLERIPKDSFHWYKNFISSLK
jgi:beta-glucosidase